MQTKAMGGYHTFHNHSVWSDGGNTIEDMLLAARKAGVREFGISDHLINFPWDDEVDWAMPMSRLDAYVEEVQRLKRKYDSGDFTLRLGLEVDYFRENHSETMTVLSRYPWDYLIGSVHYYRKFPIDNDAGDWDGISQETVNELWKWYLARLQEIPECEGFSFMGHLDLPKKFGYRPTIDCRDDIGRVLDAAARRGMPVELNTAGWLKTCQEPYPSADILAMAAARGNRVIVNADAHAAANVTSGFDRAYALLEKTGLETRQVSFQAGTLTILD